MNIRDFKRLYDQVQLSKEADERILKELLERRGEVSGEIPGGKRKLFGVAAAAVVALLLVAGGIFAAGRLSGSWLSDTKVAVREEDRDKAHAEREEKQKKGTENTGEGEEKETEKTELALKEGKEGEEPKEFQVQSVAYPVRDELGDDLPGIEEGYLESLLPFYKKSFQSMLIGKKGENQLYSPINLYFTLAMMAEMTEGESREQIMRALGQRELDKVREQSDNIWQWLYSDEEISRCILGNSLWAKQDIPLKKDTLQNLSYHYYASTYQGQMGSKAYDQTIQNWLDKMTGGNLKKYTGKIETSEDTSLLLLSAADFYGTWVNRAIDARYTESGSFYADSGKKVTCDFMTSISDSIFLRRKRFTASSLGLSGRQNMYIFLPEKDSSVEEILQKDMDEVLHICTGAENKDTSAMVTMRLPKFQIQSERDTMDTMKRLGVEDVFLPERADFSGLLETEGENGCYIGKASQAMQVSIDEEGCSISAYSEAIMLEKGMVSETEKNMCCDRPFLFVISDRNGIPVFAGVVNLPE